MSSNLGWKGFTGWLVLTAVCSVGSYLLGHIDGEERAATLYSTEAHNRQVIKLATEREQALRELEKLQTPLRLKSLNHHVAVGGLVALVAPGEVYVAFRPETENAGEPIALVIRDGNEVKFVVNPTTKEGERIRKVNFFEPPK